MTIKQILDGMKGKKPEIGLRDAVDMLVKYGYLLEEDGKFSFPPEYQSHEKRESAVWTRFNEIRKEYPGTKGGHSTEWTNFSKACRKAHTLPEELIEPLAEGIEKEKKWREAVQKLVDAEGKRNVFIEQWPHFSTWMSERRWEQERPAPEVHLGLPPRSEKVKMLQDAITRKFPFMASKPKLMLNDEEFDKLYGEYPTTETRREIWMKICAACEKIGAAIKDGKFEQKLYTLITLQK